MSWNPISAWSIVPANNVETLTGILMDEGMPPAALNDSIRTIMAAIFQSYIDPNALANLSPTQIAAWIATLGVAKIDASNINVADYQAALGIVPSLYITGDIKTTLSPTAIPAGFVKMDGSTIGDATSNATGYAGPATAALFALLWGLDPASTQLYNSSGTAIGRGTSAAADYAANDAITVPDVRGRFLRSVSASPTRTPGTMQADAMQGHVHNPSDGSQFLTIHSGGANGTTGGGNYNLNTSTGGPVNDGTNGTPRTDTETRPTNMAVRYLIAL